MAEIRDTLLSQIPGHIIEQYPRFYDFLRAYYEWLGEDGNPYERVKHHMDYMSFEKSLDTYVDKMKHEYLSDVPDSILLDKELFIRWSKKFNLARGSHESYKFLFRLLFNEQSTDIYIPKENILRTSDGNWVSGESLMMVTHSSKNLEDFQFQIITQTRPIYQDIVETATAVVQRVRTKYAGRFIVTELSVTNIDGEFKEGFPIVSSSGATEWMIPTVSDVDIADPGVNYQTGQRLVIQNNDTYCVGRTISEDDDEGIFDTRVTSFFDENDIVVEVDGTEISNFTFDGRYVESPDFVEGSEVKVDLPSYQGYIIVDAVDENQGVLNIEVLDPPIGCPETRSVVSDGLGTGLDASTVSGFVKPVKGYYEGTKGHLSSNMYLQDSVFYQNYSYAIRTGQDITAYADIVKNVLHPAGFALFGQLSIIEILELILFYQEPELDYIPFKFEVLHKYGLGPNYSFIDRFKGGVSQRLYRMYHFNTRDMELASGEDGYDLESRWLAQLMGYEYDDKKGWMTRDNLSDYHLYLPQDYSEEVESGIQYFETGYTTQKTEIRDDLIGASLFADFINCFYEQRNIQPTLSADFKESEYFTQNVYEYHGVSKGEIYYPRNSNTGTCY